jgi:hypothetical protein
MSTSSRAVGSAVIALLTLSAGLGALALPVSRIVPPGEVAKLGRVSRHDFEMTYCLGADGVVVSGVVGDDGLPALVCIDGRGPHALVRAGDPAPGGGVFRSFTWRCERVDADSVVFGVRGLDPYGGSSAIYRVSSAGIERVLGEGDLTDEGAALLWDELFSMNRHGDIVLTGRGNDRRGIFLWRDGGLRRLVDQAALVFHGVEHIDGPMLTDRGDVVFNARLAEAGSAVFVWRDGEVRLLAQDGGPLSRVRLYDVRGDDVLLLHTDRSYLRTAPKDAPRAPVEGQAPACP